MCVSRNESITAVGGSMTKKLITATILIIIGEVLSLARVYFAEAMSGIPSICLLYTSPSPRDRG